ncbi:arginine N-methyltransferase 7-like protein [Euroglyphus maynei]|uniref:Protein arginine N-methyltransferase n=1 Tax=Euroglyphus maynei TaxID=6958 RepID=A0A1Y3AQD2_EURMA|nr:arginine N-methyltransferase 7-like protein [Euroglyphus maynei]
MDQIDSDNDFADQHSTDDNDDDPLFDYYQDIARSSFDDMVHDQERNDLYYQAICQSIKKLRYKNPTKAINVLDIGSGTGLLSMMAINATADNVIACECFEPMAKCSRKIIDDNSMSSKINVMNKLSGQLELPKEFHPNLLVAELLDTELIGEGCLSIYRDIIQRKLVDPDHCLYVPTRARIWIQLVQSERLFHCHQFRKSYHFSDNFEAIQSPSSVRNCFGSHLLHDIQLNRLRPDVDFEILSDPMVIFEFEFNRLESLKYRDHKRIHFPLKRSFNQPMMIFAWWDIDLDDDGKISLSCSPYWTRGFNSEHQVAWREHWIQTIYYLPAFAFDHERQLNEFNHNHINQKQTLLIDCYHDQVSFWFDLPDQNELHNPIDVMESESWHCTCGLHSHLSRTRLEWINNVQRYQQYWSCLNERMSTIGNEMLDLIYFGDESILPFVCSQHPNVEHVWIICNDRKSYRFFRTFRRQNEQKIILCSHDSFHQKKNPSTNRAYAIISDLHFRNQSSMLSSMEFLQHLYRQQQFIRNNQNGPRFCFPHRIILRCLIVRFEHLWKCMAPVCNVKIDDRTELNLLEYDLLIMNARRNVDWQFDRRSLWEYCCWPLANETRDILDISMDCMDKNKSMNELNSLLTNGIDKIVEFNIEQLKSTKIDHNTVGIVCWIDQYIDGNDKIIISGGLENPNHLSPDEEIKWIRDQQQLVTFLSYIPNGYQRLNESEKNIELKFQIKMNPMSIKVEIL